MTAGKQNTGRVETFKQVSANRSAIELHAELFGASPAEQGQVLQAIDSVERDPMETLGVRQEEMAE